VATRSLDAPIFATIIEARYMLAMLNAGSHGHAGGIGTSHRWSSGGTPPLANSIGVQDVAWPQDTRRRKSL